MSNTMKSIILPMLCLFMMLSFSACNSKSDNENNGYASSLVSDYEANMGVDFDLMILDCWDSITVEIKTLDEVYYFITLEEHETTKTPYSDCVSNAFSAPYMKHLGQTLESVKTYYNTIESQYEKIMSFDVESTDNPKRAKNIKKQFAKLFKSYTSLYNIVTSNSGTHDSFLKAYESAMKKHNKNYSNLLEIIQS